MAFKLSFFAAFLVLLFSTSSFGQKVANFPQARHGFLPPIHTSAQKNVPKAEEPAKGALYAFLHFFQTEVSHIDGDNCSMAPTCSRYAKEAVENHGALLGWILLIDRLLHEGDEFSRAKKIKEKGETHYLDPLWHNTHFWQSPSSSHK